MNQLFMCSLLLFVLSGILSLAVKKGTAITDNICTILTVAAAAIGMIPVVHVLSGKAPMEIMMALHLPVGSFHIRMDILSAWFMVPVLLLSALTAVYGTGYMKPYAGRAGLGFNRFCYQMLTVGMVLTLVAWNGVLFLIAWEIMSLAAWFLVMFEHEKAQVRQAGWVYLAATHLGTAFLFALFLILNAKSGSFDFSGFSTAAVSFNAIFILAVLGFGSKAGFFGLHVWLPEAHPAAPSHVSALMSGVMIKTGIYGLIRIMTFCPAWPEWWGWLLIGIGVLSGVGGVLYAMVQHDIKRLLAYHSVENIGIICLGLGVGAVEISRHSLLAVPALAGALLHVWNHSIFKSGLFMGAGSVAHATGTRDIDRLGGLGKQMPVTAATFLIASVAICGLPPLNGFVSELLIYLSVFSGVAGGAASPVSLLISAFCVIAALALIGGLAALCFTKVYGVVFLGEPRQKGCATAREAGRLMTVPMILLAIICALIGLLGFLLVRQMAPVVMSVCPKGFNALDAAASLGQASAVLLYITLTTLALIGFGLLMAALRQHLHKGSVVVTAPTWGCGYTQPTPRMQYTGSSFVQPLVFAFRSLFNTRYDGPSITGYFPPDTILSTHTHDVFMHRVYKPVFRIAASLFSQLRRIQHGRLHLYVLHIVIILAVILCWSFL